MKNAGLTDFVYQSITILTTFNKPKGLFFFVRLQIEQTFGPENYTTRSSKSQEENAGQIAQKNFSYFVQKVLAFLCGCGIIKS